MNLLINISEKDKEAIDRVYLSNGMDTLPPSAEHGAAYAVHKGTPLDGLTNGEVIQKMFPDATITQKNEYVVFLEIDRYGEPKLFDATWWNGKWGEA